MNKPFYCDYIRHAMRFYARNTDLKSFRSKADESNWMACKSAMKSFTPKEQEILIKVYGSYDTLANNVYETAKLYRMNQGIIWDAMKRFEKIASVKRGLI